MGLPLRAKISEQDCLVGERLDRTEKLPAYEQLPSMREILLIDQHPRRTAPRHRTPAGRVGERYGPEDTIHLYQRRSDAQDGRHLRR